MLFPFNKSVLYLVNSSNVFDRVNLFLVVLLILSK